MLKDCGEGIVLFRKAVSGLIVVMFLASMLVLAFNVKHVKGEWTGTVYIRADGSVDPTDAPITTYDNITYTLTDDIVSSAHGIIVLRDNIIIDGSGHTILCVSVDTTVGIDVANRINITIKNTNIQGFLIGIRLLYSSRINISANNITNNGHDVRGGGIYGSGSMSNIYENNVTNNECGIFLTGGTFNNIHGNRIEANRLYGIFIKGSLNNVNENYIANNRPGIELFEASNNSINENNIVLNNEAGITIWNSTDNIIFHNNFINNTSQVGSTASVNIWDDGYPSGGNYWSDYDGADFHNGPYQNETGSDNIGDSPYVIDEDNIDRYPLMKAWVPFEGQTIYIKADGCIDPTGAPILRKGEVYTLVDNITSSWSGIVVERDNIVLDGDGHTLQGTGIGTGISLSGRTNVAVTDMQIKNFVRGIYLDHSSGNSIVGNDIISSKIGIDLEWYSNFNSIVGNNITSKRELAYGITFHYLSKHNSIIGNNIANNFIGMDFHGVSESNSIVGNNITSNEIGIQLVDSPPNKFYHNNFIGNKRQVYITYVTTPIYASIWDDGYPSGGNYWSDYGGVDYNSGPYQNETGSDFIGDTPYIIDTNNIDRYPLMFPYGAPSPKVDLSVSSLDISFSDDNPFEGQTITVTANVHNEGEENAENVVVRFLDGNVTIGEQTIPLLPPHSNRTTSIAWTAKGEGFHLIQVVVDPYNAIIETDETNNEATRSILVGKIPFVGGIVVEASVTPDTTLAGSTVIVRSSAVYNTTYGAGQPVAGADVTIAIADWAQVKTHTVWDGTFKTEITAPYTPGYYTVVVTVTDFTFIERVELGLNVTCVEGVDLTVSPTDISFSPSDPIEGQYVSITATIHNIGTQNAANVLLAFYDGDKLIGNGTIDAIAAGGASSISILWNAEPRDWHTIKVVVDPENAIVEVNENNNQASRSIYVYPLLPDLTPTSIGFSGRTPAVNQMITISANIKNIGGVSASNVLVSFFVDGQLIESVTIAKIDGKGGSKTASISYSFTTPGWHKVCVVADPDNSIVEADENNNRLCVDIHVHSPLPDLTPSITFSNNNPNLGEMVTIYATVYNVGEVEAQNITVSIYDDETRISYTTIASLNAGEYHTIEVLWNATPAGWHRIKVAVDENDTIEESDETNNIAVRYIYVSPPPEQACDLYIYSEDITFPKLVAEEGEEVTIYATIHNIGMIDAQNVTVIFYVDDVQLGLPKTISIIPVSGSETVSTKWTASGAWAHVVKVVADAPIEANKTNNVATRAIIVGEHNIAVTRVLPAKYIVEPGEILPINVTVINKGDFIETFNLTLYANTTAIQTVTLTIEGGNSTTLTIMWNTGGFASGSYTIRAYVEPVPRETAIEDNTYTDGTVQILQTFTLTITTTAGGTTEPAPGTYTYTACSTVQVTAIPSSGYVFDHWELNGTNVGSVNPYTLYMDNNYNLKAFFAPAPAPLTVSIEPLSASILVGQSVTFNSNASGGTPPYSYQWYLNGAPVSGAISDTWTFTPTEAGIYYVYLKVTDSKNNTAQSEAARIVVKVPTVGGESYPIEIPKITIAQPTDPQILIILQLAILTMIIKKTKKRNHR